MALRSQLLSLVVLVAVARPSLGQQVAIIVHPENATSSVSLAELRKIFISDIQRWETNERIFLLMQERERREKQVMLAKVYGMTDEELKKLWMGKIYRGEIAKFPPALGSNESVIRHVAQVRNAIGFVDAASVDDRVRALRIDGKLPGDAGYPLQNGSREDKAPARKDS